MKRKRGLRGFERSRNLNGMTGDVREVKRYLKMAGTALRKGECRRAMEAIVRAHGHVEVADARGAKGVARLHGKVHKLMTKSMDRCVLPGGAVKIRGARALGADIFDPPKVDEKPFPRRPRVGMRVRFSPRPVSAGLYTNPPEIGATGSVTTVPVPGGRRAYMPGPGGGLVFVKWDDGHVQGVSPIDLVRE